MCEVNFRDGSTGTVACGGSKPGDAATLAIIASNVWDVVGGDDDAALDRAEELLRKARQRV